MANTSISRLGWCALLPLQPVPHVVRYGDLALVGGHDALRSGPQQPSAMPGQPVLCLKRGNPQPLSSYQATAIRLSDSVEVAL